VSNAAVNPIVGSVLDSPEEVWDKVFDINVKCTYLLMKEALPLLKCSKSPSIIILTSLAGYQPFNVSLIKDALALISILFIFSIHHSKILISTFFQLLGIYSISKTALLGLIKATTKDLANDGIRINGIAPGVIKTKFAKPVFFYSFEEPSSPSLG